jgi:hypothetical protein
LCGRRHDGLQLMRNPLGRKAEVSVERNFARRERKTLRTLASEAYARELDQALGELASAFADWKAGRVDGFTLAQTIHAFHDGIARDLWAHYERLPPELTVRLALEAGVIGSGEISTQLQAKLGLRP